MSKRTILKKDVYYSESTISTGTVQSDEIVIAPTVKTKEIEANGMVSCQNIQNLSKMSLGGVLICTNLDSVDIPEDYKGFCAFENVESYCDYLSESLENAESNAIIENIQNDIEEVELIFEDVEFEV